jgi:hypothetical protein
MHKGITAAHSTAKQKESDTALQSSEAKHNRVLTAHHCSEQGLQTLSAMPASMLLLSLLLSHDLVCSTAVQHQYTVPSVELVACVWLFAATETVASYRSYCSVAMVPMRWHEQSHTD